jgi:diaminopimelate epimerase
MGMGYAKMHGCGNDFIMIDARAGITADRLQQLAAKLCDRRRGLGADGLVALYPAQNADFAMHYVNASGMPGEMCGNGARCAARFAQDIGLAGRETAFETDAGLVRARIEPEVVTIVLPQPDDIRLNLRLDLDGREVVVHHALVGVPHAVTFVHGLASWPVRRDGPVLRSHPAFPHGCNANFVEVRDRVVFMRTFERGVEAETLACGTGAVACVAISHRLGLCGSTAEVRTGGGDRLDVVLMCAGEHIEGATLSGPTETVARGEIDDRYLAVHGLA